MSASNLASIKKTVFAAVIGRKDFNYFWETRFLPRWLPLLLGLGLGVVVALLIVENSWHLAAPLVLAVPVAILFNRYPFIGIILWITITQFVLNEPTAAGRFIFWISHRAVVPTAIGIVILSDWLGTSKREPVKLGRAELGMLIFLGLLVTNILLLTNNYKESFISIYDRIFIPFCVYWLIRLNAPKPKDIKLFLWVALFTLLAQAIIGITSWFAPQLLPPKWLGLEGARTVGSLRNVAVYTSTLLLCSLLLFQYAIHSQSPWIRAGLFTVFGLAFYCIFMSFSRASWLSGTIILVILIFLYPKVMGKFVLVLGIAIYILGGTILANQMAWGYERLTGEASQESAESRVSANDAMVRMTQERPLFGWGYGNFNQAKRPFLRRVNDIPIYEYVSSHNTFLTLTTELGLISFFFYMFPTVWWLIVSVKNWRKIPDQDFWNKKMLLLLWLVILHIFIVSNFMDMVRVHMFGTTIWWMTLGFISTLIHPHLSNSNQ